MLAVCLFAVLSAGTPNVDTIIERHIAVRGGRQRIAALQSLVFRGEYREGDHESIVANRPYDPAVFSPPEFKRTPIQKWLEQLYAARDDVNAVLWSYRDFRQAYPATDTRSGVEFIGYQILKMGSAATAVELLKANARDYPNVAASAFGLGCAFQTAGDLANARKEFERAIALDPGYKRAADALKSLK